MQKDRMSLIFRGGCQLTNLGSSSEDKTPDFELSEVAVTLLSRDYKGLSNYHSNGVIEIWKIEKQ